MTRISTKAKILVVEDSRIEAENLKLTLEELGYSVVDIKDSAKDAIKTAEEKKPDLVMMDIMLKGKISGIEAAMQIYNYCNIPIVYLTANSNDMIVLGATITEPFGFLIKPFNELDLSIAIEMAIYRHAIESKIRHREKWLSALFDSINEAIIVVDIAGKIGYMNAIAERLTGWKYAAALGNN
ncbi:MAG: response regulator, partial [Nitrospirae bacterium]|nr:response regulator [Nitrospirota bacterium]